MLAGLTRVMDLSWRFDRWFARLPRSPCENGEVARLVLRLDHGEREAPDSIEVSPEGGVHGDRWSRDLHSTSENQVALINVHVIESLTDGNPERAILSGDNLHVDLDLSEENLPVGTLLHVGTAILEVTPKPHRPCRYFVERFGALGAKKVARADRRGRRGRGVLCRVVEAGRIQIGDRIGVERP